MTRSESWMLWALLSAIFAAVTAILAKIGVQGIDPDLATLVRTVVIAVLLSLFVLSTGKWSNPFQLPGRSLSFLLLSALATGASWVCYFRALQAGPVSLVAPIDKLSVVLVLAFAFLFLGERPSPREWLAVGMIGAGVAMLALKR